MIGLVRGTDGRRSKRVLLLAAVLLLIAAFVWLRSGHPEGAKRPVETVVELPSDPTLRTAPAPDPAESEAPTVAPPPVAPQPRIEPPPEALPAAPEPDAAVASLPEADGRALFEDGAPVAHATFSVSVPRTRVVMGVAHTDGERAFRIPVPGFGPAEMWFEVQGLRYQAFADLHRGTAVVVPCLTLHVRVEPAAEAVNVSAVALNGPPSVFRMEGLPPPTAYDVVHRDGKGVRYPRFETPMRGEGTLRLPKGDTVLVWASSGRSVSEVARLEHPRDSESILLRLADTIDVSMAVCDDAGKAPATFSLAACSDAAPLVTTRAVDGMGVISGLVPGATYALRDDDPAFVILEPASFTASRGSSVEVRVKALVTTAFLVVDAQGAPVRRAGVLISIPMNHPDAVRGGAEGGMTDETGRWVATTLSWGRATAVVSGPPGPNPGAWQGSVDTRGSHRIVIDAKPYTILRIRPHDCIAPVAQKEFWWRVPGTEPIALSEDAVVEIDGGGRYVRRQVRAKQLKPSEDEVVLEPAVTCRVGTPSGVRSMRVMQGGGLMPIGGSIVTRLEPGKFEVQGLQLGTRVGFLGMGDEPRTPCTERVDVTVGPGMVIELPPLKK